MERKGEILAKLSLATSQVLLVACNYLPDKTPVFSGVERKLFSSMSASLINGNTGHKIEVKNLGPAGLYIIDGKEISVFPLENYVDCQNCKITEEPVNKDWVDAFRITCHKRATKGRPICIRPLSPWSIVNK